jgi:hypothetical protein
MNYGAIANRLMLPKIPQTRDASAQAMTACLLEVLGDKYQKKSLLQFSIAGISAENT